MKKKITIVVYDEGAPPPDILGGGQLARIALMEYLDKSKFYPILLTSNDSDLAQYARSRGISVVVKPINPDFPRFDRTTLLKRPWNIFSTIFIGFGAARRLAAVLKDLNADIVHPNENLSRTVTLFSYFFYRIPAISHIDNEWDKGLTDQIMGRLFTWGFDKLIAVSSTVDCIAKQYTNKKGKIVIIPTGMPLEKFSGISKCYTHDLLSIPAGTLIVCTVGKLIEFKGQIRVLEALYDLIGELPDFKYILIGDGPDKEKIAERVNQLGIADKVMMLGHRDDAIKLVGGSDLVVQYSETESFGQVLVESLLCKSLVISSEVGGSNEILKDGTLGWIVPKNSTVKLKKAIVEAIVMDDTEKDKIKELGRQYAEEYYNVEVTANNVGHLYESLIKNCKQGG